MSSTYHPLMDRQTKVVNQTLTHMERYLAGDKPKQWDEVLSQVEFVDNSMKNRSTSHSPFNVVYMKMLNLR